MSRSRLCALALVPLLLAGAAACGGGDEVPAERRAAADAAFAALEEHRGPWPSLRPMARRVGLGEVGHVR